MTGTVARWFRSEILQVAAVSSLIAAIFFWFASPGLGYYFTDDDIMNLRRGWPDPVSHLAFDCIRFSPAAYRPFGLLVYRAIFALAGLHPLPFHAISFALLLVNLALLASLAHRLTGSVKIGLLAALIACFHSRMDLLYFTAAGIYDIVCLLLYIGALLWYVRIRQSGKIPNSWQIVLMLLMYVAALNGKEVAASWPVMLLAYELLYHGVVKLRSAWIIWMSATVTVLFLIRKLSSASLLVTGYKPRYSLANLLHNWSEYVSALFYGDHAWSTVYVILLLLALLVMAVVLRSKVLQFSWIFLCITPLPVMFIETRGLYVWYVPLAGWAIYAAALLAILTRRVPRIPAPVRQAAVFLACAAFLVLAHSHDRPNRFRANDGKNDQVRDFMRDISALHPTLPRSAHVLLLDDPFDTTEWTPVSIMQLYYRDPDLDVQRSKIAADRREIAATRHDFVYDYRNGRMIDVSAANKAP